MVAGATVFFLNFVVIVVVIRILHRCRAAHILFVLLRIFPKRIPYTRGARGQKGVKLSRAIWVSPTAFGAVQGDGEGRRWSATGPAWKPQPTWPASWGRVGSRFGSVDVTGFVCFGPLAPTVLLKLPSAKPLSAWCNHRSEWSRWSFTESAKSEVLLTFVDHGCWSFGHWPCRC